MVSLPRNTSPLLSNLIRRHRYNVILPLISHNILDVGCGHAYLAEFLAPGDTYTGVDIQPAFLQQVRMQYPQHRFYQIDLERERLPADLKEQRFETITLIALLEHLAQPQLILNQLSDLLSPGGRVVATTPTPFGHRIHRMGAELGLFYREAAEDHKSILSARSLHQLFSRAKLRVVIYKTFEFGCNQLIVGEATPV